MPPSALLREQAPGDYENPLLFRKKVYSASSFGIPPSPGDCMALQGPFWRFSDDGKEFIIIRRDLKQPWLNFLSTDHLNSVLTHTGIGASFGRSVWADWVQDDRSPRLVFVYDRKSQKHWTINGVESARQPKDWKCVHGFCYSTISSSTDGIDGSVTYMLPLDESAELWHIRLHNQSAQPRSLRIFPAAKFSLGVKNHEKMYDDVHFENNTILAEAYLWPTPGPRNSFPECNRNWDRIGFMTSDIKASGFDCDEAAFSGEGGSLLHNAVVPAGACRNSLTRGVSTCGVLQLDEPRSHFPSFCTFVGRLILREAKIHPIML